MKVIGIVKGMKEKTRPEISRKKIIKTRVKKKCLSAACINP
jgi:hypothetical protein